MNILMPTVGSAGDVHPLLGIGQRLKARGHEVIILANAMHEPGVRAAGLSFLSIGPKEDAEALMNNPDLWHPYRGFATIAREAVLPAVHPVYEAISRFDPATTIVAAQTMAFGARLAQERLGYRLATLHLQPAVIRSVYDMPINGVALPGWLPRRLKAATWSLMDRLIIDPILGPPLNAFRAEIGLSPCSGFFGDWKESPQRVIGLFPEWFAPPQPDWPPQSRLTGFILYDAPEEGELSEEVEAFLASDEPPVVVTFGSAMRHGRPYFEAAIEATVRIGRRLILLGRDPSQVPPLPADVLHVPYVPFSKLLPRAAALIHHGGVGTLAQALAAGIPHLVMPLSHDQPDNARRLERLGVGVSVPPRAFSGKRVARKLAYLLERPEVRREAQRLARRIDPERAREESATLIEELATE